jgi:hypothetical protein
MSSISQSLVTANALHAPGRHRAVKITEKIDEAPRLC